MIGAFIWKIFSWEKERQKRKRKSGCISQISMNTWTHPIVLHKCNISSAYHALILLAVKIFLKIYENLLEIQMRELLFNYVSIYFVLPLLNLCFKTNSSLSKRLLRFTSVFWPNNSKSTCNPNSFIKI